MKYDYLDWQKMQGLIPVIVQDVETRDVLMLGYANERAIDMTRATGLASFFSRKRNELWTKGMTSGNIMGAEAIFYDCDGDALIYRVRPNGPACHTGERTCFYRRI